jgi:signal transduction histidine kinase
MCDDVPLAAAGVTSAAGPSPAAPSPATWEPSLRRWDAYFAIILAGTLAVAVSARPQDRPAWVCAAGLGAMAPWYVLVGRPAMKTADLPSPRPLTLAAWRGSVYLAGLAVLLAVACSGNGNSAFILLALCPQCFMTEDHQRAIAAVVVLNLIPAAVVLTEHPAGEATGAAFGVAAVGTAFSVIFGNWIRSIIRQSDERAELIRALEATRGELAAAHHEAGVLAERQRLSADIHDTIAQGFTSIVMLLQAAEAGLRTDPDGAAHHLRLATQTARENLAEARTLVAGLAPAQLDGGSLDEALRRVTAATSREAGLAADVEITGEARPLGTPAEVMLLRVCQEALANVRKHARASRARVALAYEPDAVRLVVSDDGDGFDPAAASAGYGLRGMRARVADAGGTLDVASTPRSGTSVSVTVQA